jgi:hypothetical protein
MGIGYPPHNRQGRLDESLVEDDEFSNDVLSSALQEDGGFDGDGSSNRDDDISVLSLLEENARLRGLVIKLSNLVLKNVADQR